MNILGNNYYSLQKLSFDIAIKSVLIVLFITSCTTMKNTKTEQKEIVPADKLSLLDDKLKHFATKHNTLVRSPKSTYYNSVGNPPNNDSMVNREVSWIDDSIAKAIMIMPYSTNLSFSPNTWNVCIVAWLHNAPSSEKPHRTHYLLKNADIKTLEQNIDQLLVQSEERLNNIKPGDLK